MESIQKPIIVPWDYTQVAENAFEHAINIANVVQKEIALLHVVADKKDIRSAKVKLQKKCDELKAGYGVKTTPIIATGNIFTSIGEAAHDQKAEMIVMGTHGRKGAQKLFGSYALKVIVRSKVPFVVVQDKPKKPGFDTIVFPVDFRSEIKEKVYWVSYLSKHFNSKFLIFKSKVSDKGFKRGVASNIHFTEKHFKNNDISYEMHDALGKLSFEKETVNFAKEKNADMILVITTRNITFLDYFLGAKEQYILANPEKLPVMCINPRPTKLSGGFSASGG